MLAVPPHVDGRSAKMSRKGGVWDEMKRTISWVVPQLQPGEALEVQAQFESISTVSAAADGAEENAANTSASSVVMGSASRFPVLVRGEYPGIFSSLELKADFRDVLSHPIKMKLNRSGRVLHRKV